MGFIHGKLEHLFCARGQGHFTENDPLATPDDGFNGMTDLVYFDSQIGEHLSGNAFSFTEQSQEKMLRADRGMLEALRFFLCQRQDVTGPFREPVESVKKFRWSGVFSLDNLSKQLSELIKRIVRIGARLVLCMGSNTLPLEVILKIGWRKAVIGTNAIGGELAFVHQATDGDWINVEKLRYFLGSHEMFHARPFLRAKRNYA